MMMMIMMILMTVSRPESSYRCQYLLGIVYMSCNSKTASLSRELRELVSLRIPRESSAMD